MVAATGAGDLIHLRRGVYATRGACAPVVVAARHGGAVACVTAARHRGLWVLADAQETHVWMRGGGHVHAHDGCQCDVHWDDAVVDAPFAVPSVPRILRQILRCRGVEEFFVAVESALRRRILSAAGRTWLWEHTNELGRTALEFARADADSGLESLVRWRLRHRVLRVRTQVGIVSVGRVDLLIGDALIVEVDGAPHHDRPSDRHRDLRRDAHAAAWGFVTLRFDYALVVHDWETVELAILAHVDRGLHLAQ
ncbi:DUF559 domain-containing protein [Microbacterium sp. lyk4-40-TSB-66]|uniref:endonuclease domain-containing protein n=1 Tax=Microbacterium sp. lyk4-40-TSB-66 TaxID=3040294 RepID=UPI00254D2003|nr:DUF559 domain-containing protein [Microbacterium sp. lyk4-40-TSB-66]